MPGRKKSVVRGEKILIIVRDGVKQRFMEDLLTETGFTNFIIFPDSQLVLNYVTNQDADLILIETFNKEEEIDMITSIKHHKTAKNIPIIALISKDETSTSFKNKLFKVGVDDYLYLPAHEIDVAYKVTSLLKQRSLHKRLLAANKRMKDEIADAQKMLSSILPTQEEIENLCQRYDLDIATYFKPSLDLGGDFYDYKDIDNDQVVFYLWDFSGHGITSAINTFRLHSIIKDSIALNLTPGEILTRLNDAIYRLLELEYYATIFFGSINLRTKKLIYSAAACPNPILICKGSSKYREISCREFPLGVKKSHVYQSYEVDLSDVSMIMLYSDALIETPDNNNECLIATDVAQAINRIYKHNKNSPIEKSIKEYISNFKTHHGHNLTDDLTLSLIKFNA